MPQMRVPESQKLLIKTWSSILQTFLFIRKNNQFNDSEIFFLTHYFYYWNRVLGELGLLKNSLVDYLPMIYSCRIPEIQYKWLNGK